MSETPKNEAGPPQAESVSPAIDTKQLAEVANKVELDAVRLDVIASKILGRLTEVPQGRVLHDFEYRTSLRREDGRPGFDVRFELRTSLSQDRGSGEPAKIWEGVLAYVLEYRLPEVPPEDWQARLESFASVNAVINAWPYARAELSAIMNRMSLPAFLLPVYRPGRPSKGRIEYRADAPAESEQVT